ncbi:PIG-L family deacetylase [Amylibacter sp. SFDW26]|uniref:PIG-L deacetylase family protein n=1 Tax=Amylibacter sp. SFDW26 TaxID=2652722 RepID=UPI001262475A|nr:PIG-L deacetylase family protein [Amylibacter sp. SFDW26]KAB7609842.1 PIG-L family deacetylase [Amylibacter sp. SFDW26]
MIYFNKVLVVVAHPDDEVLGAGGSIRKWVDAGVQVDVHVITDGSSAQFGADQAARDRRNAHLQNACDILGVHSLFHDDFPDMRLDTVAHIEINKAISRVILRGQYDTVVCHHSGDVNKDHGCVFDSVLVATRPTPEQTVRTVMTFFVNSSSEWGGVSAGRIFIPNIFIDISDTIGVKLTALQAYQDELRDAPHPRSIDAVQARARTLGSEIGTDYAEGFHVVRTIL